MTFGYNSKVGFCKRAVSTIEDFGRELLSWIDMHRKDRPNVPLILICHSLGGIVVKKVKIIGQYISCLTISM